MKTKIMKAIALCLALVLCFGSAISVSAAEVADAPIDESKTSVSVSVPSFAGAFPKSILNIRCLHAILNTISHSNMPIILKTVSLIHVVNSNAIE